MTRLRRLPLLPCQISAPPATMKITPTVGRLMTDVLARTAKVRIAPTIATRTPPPPRAHLSSRTTGTGQRPHAIPTYPTRGTGHQRPRVAGLWGRTHGTHLPRRRVALGRR